MVGKFVGQWLSYLVFVHVQSHYQCKHSTNHPAQTAQGHPPPAPGQCIQSPQCPTMSVNTSQTSEWDRQAAALHAAEYLDC